jgi:hypothetical protein
VMDGLSGDSIGERPCMVRVSSFRILGQGCSSQFAQLFLWKAVENRSAIAVSVPTPQGT